MKCMKVSLNLNHRYREIDVIPQIIRIQYSLPKTKPKQTMLSIST